MKWIKSLLIKPKNPSFSKAQIADYLLIQSLREQVTVLEKELAFWKEKALNYRKPHSS